MATAPTNKPIPSEDPRDLKFNAGKVDEYVTSNNDYYIDRFSNKRKTIHGNNNDFNELIQKSENEFNSLLLDVEQEFNDTINTIGWVQLGDYSQGLNVTSRNQVVFYGGYWYSWRGDLPHYTTGSTIIEDGGIWSEVNPDGMWVNVIGIENTASVEKATGLKIFSKVGNVVVGDSITSTGNRFAVVYGNKLRMLTNLPASGNVEIINTTENSITIGGKKHWMLEYYGDAVNLSSDVVVGAGEKMIISGAPVIRGPSKIRGAGEVVGVIGNGSDHSVFDIKANVIESRFRSKESDTADIIVDVMQATDGAVSSVSDAIAQVKALVLSGHSDDIVMKIRAAKFVEIPAGLTIDDSCIPGFGTFNITTDNTTIVVSDSNIVVGQNSSGRLIVRPYGKEHVTFTPVMNYISSYGGNVYSSTHTKSVNPTGAIFLEAYDQNLNPVEVSSNYNKETGKLPRNKTKRITQVSGNTFSFKPQVNDYEGLIGEDLSSVALRINHNYSSSWNNISAIQPDGSVQFAVQGPWETSPTGLYFDGYYHVTGFSAPYWIRNAKYLLTNDSYCCDSEYVYMPKSVNGLYYAEPFYGFGLVINTSSVTIDGINFAYFDIPKSALQAIWSERFQNAGCIDASLSTACEFKNFRAHNITGMFMRTSKNSSFLSNFELNDIGCAGLMVANNSHNSNMHVYNFAINNTGKYSIAGTGIYTVGYNVSIAHGEIKNTSFTAITASSSWQDGDMTGVLTSGVFYDINIHSTGKLDGMVSDIHSASDFGAISCNGKSIPVDYHFSNIYMNDTNGAALVRTLFLDDGVSGFSITDSFIGAVDGQFALDARQVGSGTYNNKFLNVVVLGGVRLASLNADSLLTGVVAGGNNEFDTNGGIAFKPSVNPFRFERRSDFLTAVPYSILNSGNFTDYTFKFVTGNGLLTATAY